MKARIKNTNFEVDAFPFYSQGKFVGYTDMNSLGHLTYEKDELIFSNNCQEEPDWPLFRREAAKDILCSVLAGGVANGAKGFDAQKEELVNVSIDVADELIKQLQEK